MKKLKPQCASGWVDETLSDRAVHLIQSVAGSNDTLVEDIARLIGRFRHYRQFYDTEPQTAVLIRHLKDMAAKSDELRNDLKKLPATADALASEIMFFAWGEMFPGFERQLSSDLIRLTALMTEVAKRIEPALNRSGEKPNTLEHALLSDVAQILENADGSLGRTKEAGLAAGILTAAGVHGIPATPEKARRAVVAWRKALDRHK